ncbi:MAG: a-glycosyltransferase, Glycosyltransferase Family 4-like protein [Jatrophihabitans sp.]|nr:a-glycosyltransferase, Glycosyltransferase Family 4-like protein [Jatrophihabitans sp.]
MKVVLFCHSLVSDWNHGNAHFLRGVVHELLARGHDVKVFEPLDGWSRANLVVDQGRSAVDDIMDAFPWLRSTCFDPREPPVEEMTDGADLVLVHEWNDLHLVELLGRNKAAGGYRLLFHDTHHRAASQPEEMKRYDLSAYDGVLAFGAVIRDLYLERSWTDRAWTWHEAADVRTFHPVPDIARSGDLVWIGNWGDGERVAELHEFLLEPVRSLRLRADAFGVRYPDQAKQAMRQAGIAYRGWLPNHRAPLEFAGHAVTVHLPRRPYVEALPGIPTIRPFEALACGIPLVCAPWDDAEGLFTVGTDFLMARDGAQMGDYLREVLHDAQLAEALREQGRTTVLARHTCAHRVTELLAICTELGMTP